VASGSLFRRWINECSQRIQINEEPEEEVFQYDLYHVRNNNYILGLPFYADILGIGNRGVAMSMYQEKVVLCASSAYTKKFWLNDDFKALPEQIKHELKIMCVLFTEDVGGVLSLEFEEDGTLIMKVDSEESDYLYDEIGSVLKIKELQRTKTELLEALEIYYKVFFLGEDASDLL
jgi:hypothetical protein